jgi:hypothetical protein
MQCQMQFAKDGSIQLTFYLFVSHRMRQGCVTRVLFYGLATIKLHLAETGAFKLTLQHFTFRPQIVLHHPGKKIEFEF